MSRTKTFTRTSVLNRAIPVFLKRGYAGTSIQDLELATGLNKSSLYAEFENKEALYLACMDHFAEFKSASTILIKKPYGWANIQSFLSYVGEHETKSATGCFIMYSVREYDILSDTLKQQNEFYIEKLRELLIENISAEKTRAQPDAIANVVIRIFAGAALLRNVRGLEKTDRSQSVQSIMTMLSNL